MSDNNLQPFRILDYAQCGVSASSLANDALLTLAIGRARESDKWTVVGNTELQMPYAGIYSVQLVCGNLTSSDTANPKELRIDLDGVGALQGFATRFSATAADKVSLSISTVFRIEDPNTQLIRVINKSGSGNVSLSSTSGSLLVRRIG